MSNEKQSVALGSMAASALMTVGKLIVGVSTGSLGILSEALHSLLDFGATVLTYMAVRMSDKLADDHHPYGHGKIESIAALAETVLLFITSFWILYEATHRLVVGSFEVEATWWSVAVIGVCIGVDISRARALMRVAKATRSQALEADALHFSSDVLSSCVVLAGLGFVAMGWPMADAIAAIGVSLFVCRAGWVMGKRTIDTLIDTAPGGAVEGMKAVIASVEGVAGVKRVRMRPAGSIFFVDADIMVGRGLSMAQVTQLCNTVIQTIKTRMPEAEVTLSPHPLALDTETIHQRVTIIAAGLDAHVHHITTHHVEETLFVGLDLEVDGQKTIREAHEITLLLENAIRAEFGSQTEVETHIEPLYDMGVNGIDAGEQARETIQELVTSIARQNGSVEDIHGVVVRKTDKGLVVIFHCHVPPSRSVTDVHEAVDAIEHLVRQAYPGIWRMVGHAEPKED